MNRTKRLLTSVLALGMVFSVAVTSAFALADSDNDLTGTTVETPAETPAETPDEPAETPDEPVETPDEPVETPDEPVETPDEPIEIPDETPDDVMPGDLDGNGAVDIADVVLMRAGIVGNIELTEAQNKAADVNNDGNVDIADVVVTRDMIVNG
ncbi:MAG: dockerin type I domain-containing protein [Oscillospiraceae bacterium]